MDHTQHDTLSILRTIEDRFGLQPLNARDANASSLASNFQTESNASLGLAYLQRDADNPSMFALIVGGSQAADHIVISQSEAGIRVQILKGAVRLDQTFNAGISRIEIYAQGGNDKIEISNAVTIPAFVFAGDGNDTLQGGGGPAVLVGGQGNDRITGGIAPSILIGGSGSDRLAGGSGNDILIGGVTQFDANIAALKSILAEWTRTDASYNQKVADLTGGSTGGLNGSYFLNTATVFDDGSTDSLLGASGGLNLYFARLAGANKDHLGHLNPGEIVINI